MADIIYCRVHNAHATETKVTRSNLSAILFFAEFIAKLTAKLKANVLGKGLHKLVLKGTTIKLRISD